MYNKRTKIFFGVMAFLLVVGYPLSLLGSFSGFTNLFTSNSSTNPKSIITSARNDIKNHPNDKSRVEDDLRKLGVSYTTLAESGGAGVDQDLASAAAAYQQWSKLDPTSTDAQQALGNIYNDTAQLATANASAPGTASAVATQDQATATQNYQNAEKVYAKLATNKTAEEYDEYVLAWGQAADAAKDYTTALTACKLFLKLAPDDENAAEATACVTDAKTNLKNPTGSSAGASTPITVG